MEVPASTLSDVADFIQQSNDLLSKNAADREKLAQAAPEVVDTLIKQGLLESTARDHAIEKMIDDPLTVLQSLKKTATMVAPAPMGGPDTGLSDSKTANSRENMKESDRVFLEKLGF